MPQTFNWFPDVGASREVEPRVLVAPYGDGYEQRVQNGINSIKETWQLRFTRDFATGSAILTFLKERGGWEAFNWSDPDGVLGLWVCRKWSNERRNGEGVMEISATFERVY